MNNRIVVLVDGYNLYHSIDDNPFYHKYKWLDIMTLAKRIVPNSYSMQDLYYFTSLMKWKPDKMKRHIVFIRALETTGVKVIYGEFKLRDRLCTNCNKEYQGHEEKQTDVNLAISLFSLAIEDRYDTALVVTGDSDIIPSIKAVRKMFPAKRIGVAIPIGREAEEIKNVASFYLRLKEKHFKTSLFPDEIDLGNGEKLIKPATWV